MNTIINKKEGDKTLQTPRLIFFTLFICIPLMVKANPQENWTLGVQPAFGTTLLYNQDHLFQEQQYGLDLYYLKDISHCTDPWIKSSSAKAVGIGFFFRNLNNFKGYFDNAADSYGQAYGWAAVASFQLAQYHKISFLLTPGFGLSYSNKTHYTNPANRLIQRHMNYVMKADLGIECPLSQKLNLLAGFGFLHLSNGGSFEPNIGINTGHIYMGINLHEDHRDTCFSYMNYAPLQKNAFAIGAGYGLRGVYNQKGKSFAKSGFYLGYNYYINDFVSLTNGLDLVYYYDRFDAKRFDKTFQGFATSYTRWRAGLSLGLDLNIWRITINAQYGKFLYYHSYYETIAWYWTAGPIIYFNSRIGLQLKAIAVHAMNGWDLDYVNYGFICKI